MGFGRCRLHPIRFIRCFIFVLFLVVCFTVFWQYLSTRKNTVDDLLRADGESDWIAKQHFEMTQMKHRLRTEHANNILKNKQKEYSDGESPQATLDYIGKYLDVNYDVLGNEVGRYFINLTLTNKGTNVIHSCCWTIYFYHMKFIDVHSFNSGLQLKMINERGNKGVSNDVVFSLQHVNGYTFKLQPTNRFLGLDPGEKLSLKLTGGGWAVSVSEVIPNWYVANDFFRSEPRLLQSTAGEEMKFVDKFDSLKKTLRVEGDLFHPFSAEERYKKQKVQDLHEAPSFILPTPLSLQLNANGKKLLINPKEWVVSYVSGLQNEALYIKEKLGISEWNEVTIERTRSKAQCRLKSITIHLSDNMPKSFSNSITTPDKYVFVVGANKDCISIFSPTAAGVFYGAVSLVAIAIPDPNAGNIFTLPGVVMADGPRYSYRGIMVDVVRHFHTKEELLRLMEAMATFKLNKLHVHLADDEGWRLEIPGLDELTDVGGRRGHDVDERDHLMSMIGSGPFTNSSGSGFYSVKDYKEILVYAKSRHIQIIPEFDMPSHSHAAIKSMESRYFRLKEKGDEKEGIKFLLSDLLDRSVYTTGQFFKDSAINPCIESTYRFVEHVIREVINVHQDIQPLEVFHFGGDEVPQQALIGSPACTQFLEHHKQLTNTKDIKTYFVRRVNTILSKYGVVAMGWEDAFTMTTGSAIDINEFGSKGVISQSWYNSWEAGSLRAYHFANLGYKVVLSPTTHFYYDNPQEPDPDDWGLHWASRYCNTKRSFNFIPDSLYNSIDYEFWGRRITKEEICDTRRIQCTPLKIPENIIGIEAVMWSELIRTPDRMDSMLWPRLLALAERSWHKADWETIDNSAERLTAREEDWKNFANSVGHRELKRLESLNINYYLTRPGALVRNGKLWKVNTAFPGLIVQVSSNDGITWKDYDTNKNYTGHLLLVTRSFDGNRRSIPVSLNITNSL